MPRLSHLFSVAPWRGASAANGEMFSSLAVAHSPKSHRELYRAVRCCAAFPFLANYTGAYRIVCSQGSPMMSLFIAAVSRAAAGTSFRSPFKDVRCGTIAPRLPFAYFEDFPQHLAFLPWWGSLKKLLNRELHG